MIMMFNRIFVSPTMQWSFGLHGLREPDGPGAEKNQQDRDCINDDHREPDGSGPLLLDDKVERREGERSHDGRQAYSRCQHALELALASFVNLPGSQRLQRRCSEASESEDGHDGEDDPSPVCESHDDQSDRGAGNPNENSPAVAEQLVAGPGKSACTSVWQTPNVPSERPIQRLFQWNASKAQSAQQVP